MAVHKLGQNSEEIVKILDIYPEFLQMLFRFIRTSRDLFTSISDDPIYFIFGSVFAQHLCVLVEIR